MQDPNGDESEIHLKPRDCGFVPKKVTLVICGLYTTLFESQDLIRIPFIVT